MRLLFVQQNALDESIALAELSSWLRGLGHQTTLLLDREERDLVAAAVAWQPDVICVSISLSNQHWGYAAAHRLHSATRAPIVAAGAQVTFFPEHALEHSPAIAAIEGEAEAPMAAILDRLLAKTSLVGIPGVSARRGAAVVRTPATEPFDITRLGLPDRHLYWDRYPFLLRFPWKKFTTSRGCIHRCAHCVNPRMNDLYALPAPRVRKKTVDQVLAELHQAVAAGPLRQLHFADDLFTADVPWLERFAPRYRQEIGRPFTCNSSAELMSDRAARALQTAGCHGVAIALETGNEAVRQNVLRRDASNARFAQAVRCAQGAGLRVLSFNMVGVPGETEADIQQTIAINRDLGIDYQRVSLCTPLDGTELAQIARDMDWLAPEQSADLDSSDGERPWRTGLVWRGPKAPAQADLDRMHRLYHLFRLYVHHPTAARWLGPSLMRLPPRFLSPLQGLGALHERRFNNIGWVDGLRYYRHVGSPASRTNITPTLL